MKRREFITLLGGAGVAWPGIARAQNTERMRRVGVLMSGGESNPGSQTRIAAFVQGMQTAGWIDGRNVQFDIRSPGPDPERMRAVAMEMVTSAPDVIVSTSTLM
jgi:putative ABC transport system substrate-binding protein